MSKNSKKPRVGTYSSDATVAEATAGKATDTTAKTNSGKTAEKKEGGLPSWAVGLIVLALAILVIRLIF